MGAPRPWSNVADRPPCDPQGAPTARKNHATARPPGARSHRTAARMRISPKARGGSRAACTRARAPPAPPGAPSRIMAPCQVSSATKVAKTAAPAIGRGGVATCDWVPRPPRSTEVFEPDVPRSKVGVNEYLYALSRRHPAAVWCASAAMARLLGASSAWLVRTPDGAARRAPSSAGRLGGGATAAGSSIRSPRACARCTSSCTSSMSRPPQ